MELDLSFAYCKIKISKILSKKTDFKLINKSEYIRILPRLGIHKILLYYFRVTSIALRALHFTLDTFWAELLYVPQDTGNRLALWLCKKQYLEGYWVEESIIYDRNMKVEEKKMFSFHHI